MSTNEGLEQGEQRVTTLELFFDLVFVFAITQVSLFFSHDPTWGGLLRGLMVLAALWWAWSGFAWLTNALDPEEGAIRLAVLAAVAALAIVSLAVPQAFGADGVVFGVAYLVVRGLHVALFARAGRLRDDGESRPAARALAVTMAAPVLLVVAGFIDGPSQLALWVVALAILYLSPVVGRMRGFRVSPGHFVERFGLIVIIALGESIVAIGAGAAGLELDAGVIGAALLGVTVSSCLWWSYFDWSTYVSQARMVELTGIPRAIFARDAFSYLHLPMVAGIVLFAFGLKTVLPDVTGHLPWVPAFGLVGGIALYMAAHVALRLRIGGGWGRGRPVAAAALVVLLPVATVVPAIAALGMVAAVCVALIVYEFLRHRQERAWIRSHRGGFTMDEAREQLGARDRGRGVVEDAADG
ncbi:MAG TPA: low temperature requirement protein A [Actinomycetota bacterium]|nr:low temperature requirement protein A [Actinomycetota bacterium]